MKRCSDEVRINPAWLATQAIDEMGDGQKLPPLIYQAAHLQLRQIARSICRKKFDEDGPGKEQHEMFPVLQKRYPAAHSSEADPEYILLEYLNEKDKTFNVNRLRREGKSKLLHASTLEAWWRENKAAA